MQAITCLNCNNYINNLKCLAFLDGIPHEILNGTNNHSKPLKGQDNDIVFEPKK